MARCSSQSCFGPHHQNLKTSPTSGGWISVDETDRFSGAIDLGVPRATQNILISSCKSLLSPVQCCVSFWKGPTEMASKHGHQSGYSVSSLMMHPLGQ